MLTVHWLSIQDQADSVKAQSMTAAMTPLDEVVATDSDNEADTEMQAVRNLHFSVGSNSTADAME